MPKLLQINITANWGSHGKIAEDIGALTIENGWDSHIAYGRRSNESKSQLYHIGNMADEYLHGIASRIFDNHGLMSVGATKKLIDYIRQINPDIIHLHNIHGYYLNYPLLFEYLSKYGKPVVWTLHDCWTFTGHCAHYMFANCEKWKTECNNCPLLSNYPASMLFDRSKKNFQQKKQSFLSVDNLTLVPVSKWLEGELRQSFFKTKNIHLIQNGIDVQRFTPIGQKDNILAKYGIPQNKKVILGVASNWYRKGLDDFIAIRHMLPNDYHIILVGLSKKDKKKLPNNIIGIMRTENIDELVALYSACDVFFNPTWEDNFPTTNLEAMACGTPVITYNTGGSPEVITPETGIVIERGDLQSAVNAIKQVCIKGEKTYNDVCRNNILEHYNRMTMLNNYMALYHSLL
ncbi:glycosyltransferase [Prevotella sp. tf2-5]|uniref:glycosyltransferase n=1 Tax=Prevotella sp. tf2-5 TaxID=1761889 RepID=UPI0008ECC57E|nr:glycosyltransferase [Prevotella sp. tf2-5]SFO88573.1 Glycosyltransferase involved in cell wall bisynthesis [Prevotella sp. tf2-5]